MFVLTTICNEKIFDKKYLISLSLKKDIKQQIIDETKWMINTTPFKIRCLAIHMNYNKENFPKCLVCNNPVTYDKAYQNKFSYYCGPVCSRKHKHRLNSNTYQQLQDKEWLYNQRINLKKSYEEIAIELNCSVIPIRKACKTLNIPLIKHNCSQPLILYKLQDKEWLFQKHCIEKRTEENIAELIGSSKATISRWLTYHNIKTNNSNIYPRKFIKNSKEQQELINYIKNLLPHEKIIINDRSILNGKEIDIWFPNLHIAIEYNGIYSHLFRPEIKNESLRKDRNYHINKTLNCENKNIRLIHIFSDDWLFKKDIWKSILANIFNKISNIHYARKLQIKIPSKTDKKIFLNENHLQGNDKSSIFLGLYNNNDLVALMTFCKSRYNKNYDWELSRYCVKLNYNCTGGFSRLLSHFEKHYDGSIISYADFSRSQGNVYIKNKFKLLKQNPPSYSYVNLNKSIKRLHRSNFTKKNLNIPTNQTEENYMIENGYNKIFDCGTLVYVKNIKT